MITFNIPGVNPVNAEHLVLDYNGTVAADGILLPGIKEILNELSGSINIHVITADTFGSVTAQMTGINCEVVIIDEHYQSEHKKEFIKRLGHENVIAIGNGANDSSMLKKAAIGIAVIQKEGASLNALLNASIVCTSIFDALDLLKNPLRVAATLRV
jgi:P-type E1-E2 ATPase